MAITLDKSHQEDHLGLAMRLEELDVTSLYIGTVKQPAAADKYVAVTDASTYTVLALNSGKTHVVPDLTQDCIISLPTAASGLEFTFIYGGIAADVSDFQLNTGADANYFMGGLMHADLDGDLNTPIAGDGNSNSRVNILVPDRGTRVELVCDGTLWYLSGMVSSATVPTFADQ